MAATRRETREESGHEAGDSYLVGVYSNPDRLEEGVPERVRCALSCEWTGG